MEEKTGKKRKEPLSRQVTLGSRPEYAELGEWIRKLRESRGLQQRPISRALGKPDQYLTKVEAGKQRIDVVEFLDLLDELGVKSDTTLIEYLDAFLIDRQ